jgi:ribosomal protein S18 acetylase RimI-like enzyme
MTEEEYGPWENLGTEAFMKSWTERGVPEDEARTRALQTNAELLPDGRATADMLFSVLEHEGTPVGTLWTGRRRGKAFVYKVESDARHRGKGHGRTLMLLAEAQGIAAGLPTIRLNVFAGNTPAERLYESLGYETVERHLYKSLV